MRILLTKSQVADKVQELGAQISEDYQDKNPILIGLLKGSVVFLSDLMRPLTIPHTIDFIRASSYGAGMTSSGQVRVTSMDVDVENRHVLLIEDIIDSGVTLQYIKEVFLEKKLNIYGRTADTSAKCKIDHTLAVINYFLALQTVKHTSGRMSHNI